MMKQEKFSPNNKLLTIFLVMIVLLGALTAVTFFRLTKIDTVTLSGEIGRLEEALEERKARVDSALRKSNDIHDASSELANKFKEAVSIRCSNASKPKFCYYHAAIAFNEPNFCPLARISGLKNGCFSELALTNNNKQLCQKISDEQEKTSCIAATTDNTELCKTLSDDLQQIQCFYDVASVQGKVEACRNLPNDVDYNRRICFSKMARDRKNPAYCEEICKKPVSPQRCNQSEDLWKGGCYMKLGIVTQNSEYCYKTFTNAQKYYCLAVVEKDPALCKNILGSQYHYNCKAITEADKPIDYEDLFGP